MRSSHTGGEWGKKQNRSQEVETRLGIYGVNLVRDIRVEIAVTKKELEVLPPPHHQT